MQDLRGASNTLGNYVGLLRTSQDDAEREQILTGIEGGSAHLERLVGALLDVARLDSGERTMGPVDLDAVVEDVPRRLAVSHPQVVVSHDPLPTVGGVLSELTQVFDNLVRNAAVHGGRDDLHIVITSETDESSPDAADAPGVTIDVRDDGRGIDPEDRESVFRLFKRGRSAARGGSGVGLNIVRRIVEAHGGTVELLDNDPGAHFRVRLPIRHGVTREPAAATPSRTAGVAG